ncbi:hypothetical protein RRG08_000882, partial [Elysia crispata]
QLGTHLSGAGHSLLSSITTPNKTTRYSLVWGWPQFAVFHHNAKQNNSVLTCLGLATVCCLPSPRLTKQLGTHLSGAGHSLLSSITTPNKTTRYSLGWGWPRLPVFHHHA